MMSARSRRACRALALPVLFALVPSSAAAAVQSTGAPAGGRGLQVAQRPAETPWWLLKREKETLTPPKPITEPAKKPTPDALFPSGPLRPARPAGSTDPRKPDGGLPVLSGAEVIENTPAAPPGLGLPRAPGDDGTMLGADASDDEGNGRRLAVFFLVAAGLLALGCGGVLAMYHVLQPGEEEPEPTRRPEKGRGKRLAAP